MADKINSAYTLKIETIYTDADTRTINLSNPRSDLTNQDIENLSEYLAENNALIGDKTGAQFGRIIKATRIRKITRVIDTSAS